MKRSIFAVLPALALVAGTDASILRTHNLVVLGDHSIQTDVEGRAYIGGNLTGNGDFGNQLTPSANFQGVDVLTVAGNINVGNINLNAGNLRRGGTRNGNINFNGVGGQQIIDNTLAAGVAAIRTELTTTSAVLANLVPDSTIVAPSGQPGPVTFNANPGSDGIAVFNFNGALLSNSLVQQYNLNINGATAIVVNVSGTSLTFNQGNFTGNWTSAFARANVIWNFSAATSITLNSNFYGAVLAPGASLTNSSNIDGSVFVNSFTQRGEVHLPLYTGVIPSPGAASLLCLVGLLAERRRRR